MIDIKCGCNKVRQLPESAVGKRVVCPKCNQLMFIVSAEPMPEGAGAGDFDAELVVLAGPAMVANRFLLGGVSEISIGKLADRNVVLAGAMVSRGHCKLVRLDFGPSRWKLVDNASTNGLFINGQRIAEQELQNGDVLTIGEYQLKFVQVHPMALSAAALQDIPASALQDLGDVSPAQGTVPSYAGPACPSCNMPVAANAKICVRCGINIATGRPLITSQGVDLNSLYEAAYQWIRWVSLLVWVTPMPIPIRSQAFGTSKPYAIWTITAATILASITFFIAQNYGGTGELDRPGTNLMLWSPYTSRDAPIVSPSKLHAIAQQMTDEERDSLRKDYDPSGKMTDDELVAAIVASLTASRGEFHPYQLITNAFLHDTSSIYNFLMHLAGNMVFLLVFGTRVNALIGNIATAILYPILAIAASGIFILMEGANATGPALGASGAIMGLAGMYLILFPVHQVVCAMWISIWLRFYRYFACKIFQLRGFWVLLMYFGYDILMNAISSYFGVHSGVAHWAHIGGFTTGMTLALVILFSRQFNTHGGDLLSVTLGRYAWPLIGKPSRWYVTPVKAKAAPKKGALRGADFAV